MSLTEQQPGQSSSFAYMLGAIYAALSSPEAITADVLDTNKPVIRVRWGMHAVNVTVEPLPDMR